MNEILSSLYVGIDVSSKTNAVLALDFQANVLLDFKIENNLPGANKILRKIIQCLEDNHLTKVIIALESTAYYSLHLASFLSSNKDILVYKSEVYCLNPKRTKAYKKTLKYDSKTDPTDAYTLADYARANKITTQPWKGSQYLALKRLARHRLHLVESLSREKSYSLNNIYLKFSELAVSSNELDLFSNTFGATASAVINDFLSLDEIVYTPLDELIDFLNEKSKNHFYDSETKAKILKKAARDSYKLDKCAYEPLNNAIASSFNLIKTFRREIKLVDNSLHQAIKGLNTTEYQSLISIPGIGPTLAAGILAEIGSIEFFDSHDALAKYAGLTWRKTESGNYSSDNTPMTKTGDKYLRYYLIQAANSVRKYAPEYKAYYQKKYNESSTHKHKRALALTARKLVRLIFALLSKSQLYSNKKVESKTTQ
jgi:transposase